MSLVWFGDAFDLVLRLVIGNVFVRLRDFSGIGHAKAVVIGVRLIGGIGPALVDHQTPGRIWMFNDRLFFAPLDDFYRQQFSKDRQRFIERAALVVAFRESNRLKHGCFPKKIVSYNESLLYY